jgi:hypothetical protein
MAVTITSRNRYDVRGLSASLGLIALLLAGCSSSGAGTQVSPVASVCADGVGTTGGGAVTPAPGVQGKTRYIFRCDEPAVDYTKATRNLADLAATVPGVGTMGLKSTPDSVAVLIAEDDPSVPWSTRLLAAERKMFQTFAEDKSMGDWFILVSDVVVHGGLDPIPPTAYRWTRQQVQDYVSCGIPATGRNDCTTAFIHAASGTNTIILAAQGGAPRGR